MNSSVRRVNIFGGPGIGKSYKALEITRSLKIVFPDKNVELVTEYVKTWAFENRIPSGFDQFYICAKQLRTEEIRLRNKIDIIVTDSPLLLQCMYAKLANIPIADELIKISLEFEKVYPSYNTVLKRNYPYNPVGRFQTEEQAKQIDNIIVKYLKEWNISYVTES